MLQNKQTKQTKQTRYAHIVSHVALFPCSVTISQGNSSHRHICLLTGKCFLLLGIRYRHKCWTGQRSPAAYKIESSVIVGIVYIYVFFTNLKLIGALLVVGFICLGTLQYMIPMLPVTDIAVPYI